MARLTHLRELKQPLEYPSCGSVFKRPLGHFAGQLIMDAGLKVIELVESKFLKTRWLYGQCC